MTDRKDQFALLDEIQASLIQQMAADKTGSTAGHVVHGFMLGAINMEMQGTKLEPHARASLNLVYLHFPELREQVLDFLIQCRIDAGWPHAPEA